ncbi:MAG: DUF952 domain-containing protein [bacterium]
MKIYILFILGCSLLLLLPACWPGRDGNLQDKSLDKTAHESLSKSLKTDALYKIVPAQNYTPENQTESVKLMPLDVESGFIHVSLGNQAEKILQKFFKDSKDTILLELNPQVLQQHGLEIRKEQNKPGGDFFPHIYGVQKIPVKAVVSVIKVVENSDGTWAVAN